MRLVLLALLIVTMAGSAAAMDVVRPSTGIPFQAVRYGVSCAGINFDSAFYQDDTKVYGNVLDAGVVGGDLTTLTFTHYGYGFTAPTYAYNVSVWDPAACVKSYELLGLAAANAASAPVTETVPLPANWAVTGFFFIGIQPQQCWSVGDCYPDITFDYDAVTPSPLVGGCGAAVDLIDPLNPFCYQIQAQDAQGVLWPIDFLVSAAIADPVVTGACCIPGALCQIMTQAACTTAAGQYMGDGSICQANTCVTPVEIVTWGRVKALYR
jgi:hypothetical protein